MDCRVKPGNDSRKSIGYSDAADERRRRGRTVDRRAGITSLYCLPGVQSDHLFNALFDAGDAIRVVHTRHEQGAAYMALGAALATGRPAAYSVVPGPGFLNPAPRSPPPTRPAQKCWR